MTTLSSHPTLHDSMAHSFEKIKEPLENDNEWHLPSRVVHVSSFLWYSPNSNYNLETLENMIK